MAGGTWNICLKVQRQIKMDILIFKTVNEERTKRLLSSIDTLNNRVYMIMPESEISIYSGAGWNIQCIGTKEKCIDYGTIMEEDRIPDIMFHEVWVLSPDINSIYAYSEIYAVISELRYRKVCYKVIKKDEIVTYNLNKELMFSRMHDLMVSAVTKYMTLFYRIEKKVKGCK
ncbi:MAG: hypothetical protein K2L82_03250 [Lachnospiraceae bacterium]|nr:hypothetical protein [Lachnospiraceae bacterium]